MGEDKEEIAEEGRANEKEENKEEEESETEGGDRDGVETAEEERKEIEEREEGEEMEEIGEKEEKAIFKKGGGFWATEKQTTYDFKGGKTSGERLTVASARERVLHRDFSAWSTDCNKQTKNIMQNEIVIVKANRIHQIWTGEKKYWWCFGGGGGRRRRRGRGRGGWRRGGRRSRKKKQRGRG